MNRASNLKLAESLSKELLSLSMFPELTVDDVLYVRDKITEFFKEKHDYVEGQDVYDIIYRPKMEKVFNRAKNSTQYPHELNLTYKVNMRMYEATRSEVFLLTDKECWN